MEVLQTSALPLGDGAGRNSIGAGRVRPRLEAAATARGTVGMVRHAMREIGAGNGIRTRDFDLGKVALYH